MNIMNISNLELILSSYPENMDIIDIKDGVFIKMCQEVAQKSILCDDAYSKNGYVIGQYEWLKDMAKRYPYSVPGTPGYEIGEEERLAKSIMHYDSIEEMEADTGCNLAKNGYPSPEKE